MNSRLFLAASLILAAPLAFAQQTAPSPDQQRTPPPMPQHEDAPGYPGGFGPGPRDAQQFHREAMHERHLGGYGDEMGDGMHGLRGFGLPPGDFWKNTEFATRLGLTPEQTKHLEDLSLQSQLQLIHMHATLQEQELLLQPLLSGPSLDESKAQAQIDKIADTRASIEKADAKAMLSMRAVLTPEQWTKLHAERRHGFREGAHGDWQERFGQQAQEKQEPEARRGSGQTGGPASF